jgi:hypothetical protein
MEFTMSCLNIFELAQSDTKPRQTSVWMPIQNPDTIHAPRDCEWSALTSELSVKVKSKDCEFSCNNPNLFRDKTYTAPNPVCAKWNYRAFTIRGNTTTPQVGRLLIQPYSWYLPLDLVSEFQKRHLVIFRTTTTRRHSGPSNHLFK